MVDEDLALVVRALTGDLAAYGALVTRYQFDALRVAAAIAGPAHAEDAAQDAFVRAFTALRRFDQDRPFRPWLMTIVANTARNHRRSSRRWERSTVDEEALRHCVTPLAATPEEIVVQRQGDRQLFAALDRLPRAQRDVVACRYLMDLSEDETANVLKIPRGTVKSRLARGLTRLARSIGQESSDD